MDIKKPLIRQAGSAEAFVGSAATGREQFLYHSFILRVSAPLVQVFNAMVRSWIRAYHCIEASSSDQYKPCQCIDLELNGAPMQAVGAP